MDVEALKKFMIASYFTMHFFVHASYADVVHTYSTGSVQIEKLAKWNGVRRKRVGQISLSRRRRRILLWPTTLIDVDAPEFAAVRKNCYGSTPKPIRTKSTDRAKCSRDEWGTRPREVRGFCGERNNLERRADECGEYEREKTQHVVPEIRRSRTVPGYYQSFREFHQKIRFDARLKEKDNAVKWRGRCVIEYIHLRRRN